MKLEVVVELVLLTLSVVVAVTVYAWVSVRFVEAIPEYVQLVVPVAVM